MVEGDPLYSKLTDVNVNLTFSATRRPVFAHPGEQLGVLISLETEPLDFREGPPKLPG